MRNVFNMGYGRFMFNEDRAYKSAVPIPSTAQVTTQVSASAIRAGAQSFGIVASSTAHGSRGAANFLTVSVPATFAASLLAAVYGDVWSQIQASFAASSTRKVEGITQASNISVSSSIHPTLFSWDEHTENDTVWTDVPETSETWTNVPLSTLEWEKVR